MLGAKCAYDGKHRLDERVVKLFKKELLIPVCPEQLGGLSTPRNPAGMLNCSGEEVLDGKNPLNNISGQDVSKNFVRGAEETLRIARLFNVKEFIGKVRSPSCGHSQTSTPFSETHIAGDGVTVALLKRNGIKVISNEDLRSE